MLQHYVVLKYREGTSAAHVDAFCERMLALRGAIPEIRHIEIGRDELHGGAVVDARPHLAERTAARAAATERRIA
jgi:hypothetical protein